MRKVWYFLFHWFIKITGVLPYLFCFKTKVYYEEKKTQNRRIKGKAILLSNHRSVWDVAVMMFTFPTRTLRTVIAEVMFQKNPFMRIFLQALGGIKVEREKHDFAFIEKSCKILEQNGVVEIYPEARLPKKNEQTPLPFKPSAGVLAIEILPRAAAIQAQGIVDVEAYMKEKVQEINKGLPSFERINKIIVRESDFIRSPSMKIVRNQNANDKK